MAACPVCETPIPPGALECVTCGHIFHAGAVEASVVPLTDLDPTLVSVPDVPIEATPDLEPTSFGTFAEAAPEPVPDLEPTLTQAVQVTADSVPGLETTRLGEDELPSSLETTVRCSYCENEGQTEGLFCDRCGMRLPALPGGAPVELAEVPLPEGTKCRACGCRVFADGRCTDCGVVQPTAD